MVHCCVPGCINHSSKTTNISYHRIPNDIGLQKAWFARIRRDNLPPLQNCYVCSPHFADDCYERDLKAQSMPELKVRRRLKSVSMRKPGRTRQEVIRLKSPISLKLGTNVGFGE